MGWAGNGIELEIYNGEDLVAEGRASGGSVGTFEVEDPGRNCPNCCKMTRFLTRNIREQRKIDNTNAGFVAGHTAWDTDRYCWHCGHVFNDRCYVITAEFLGAVGGCVVGKRGNTTSGLAVSEWETDRTFSDPNTPETEFLGTGSEVTGTDALFRVTKWVQDVVVELDGRKISR